MVIAAFILIVLLIICIQAYHAQQNNNNQIEKHKGEIAEQNIILRDLTDRQSRLIIEKEWLAKEVHHRVKNNLQIIISLLDFQSKYLEDPIAFTAIKNSQNRVRAISLIHQRLHQKEDFQCIDIQIIIRDIVRYLKESLMNNDNIEFKIKSISVKMDVTKAVPIGLILNEAITNSIKHAFSGQSVGEINIELDYDLENNLILSISDNGQGLPIGFDLKKSNSLGFYLIKTMSDQLDAEFKLINHEGLAFNFKFNKDR
ncbi:sensor histidine kinase [Pedobacter sp.]|jgi:two-component sensor histidine kinase|uniref:sensor histidine kinase n=1 Tax=Pedobacter sp. TaxID=1411316 RepID=UPI002C452B25|nr:histidine kinase dimerization/phosphoacceptor domain -containing protein [Pedobacter sp.]HWW39876.1 histidine kinase dimerization/phosphoacceptor domain -containing protein [Pedobacter sp.]